MAQCGLEVTESTQLLQNAKSNDLRKDNSDDMGHRREPPVSWWQRPSVYWLLGPYTLYMIASGGIAVPELNLILELVCRQHYAGQQLLHPEMEFSPVLAGADNPQCKEPGPQKKVATFMLVSNLAGGILSAIVTPKLGQLSDRYGRTRLLALTSCGGLLNEGIRILAAEFPDAVDYRWMILGSVIEGLGGATAAASTLSQSYTSDCTAPSDRAVFFGYMTACIYVGLAVGPLLSGYLVEWTGSLVSIFYVAALCHLVFIVMTGFIIPESLSKERQSKARDAWEEERRERRDIDRLESKSWWSKARAGNPLLPIEILWPTGPGTSSRLRVNLIALATANAALVGATSAMGPVVLLYVEFMFQWGNLETSKFVSAVGIARVLVLVAVSPAINYFGRTRPAARRRRETGQVVVVEEGEGEGSTGADSIDTWLLRLSLGLEILGALGCIFARSVPLFVASVLLGSLQGLGGATIQSMVTKHFPPERVGQILGAVATTGALARVMSPIMFDGTYALAVETFPQAIYVVFGGLLSLALLSSIFIRTGVHWEDVKQCDDTPTELVARMSEDDASPTIMEAEEEQGLLQPELRARR